jgi:hypothetical protein
MLWFRTKGWFVLKVLSTQMLFKNGKGYDTAGTCGLPYFETNSNVLGIPQ